MSKQNLASDLHDKIEVRLLVTVHLQPLFLSQPLLGSGCEELVVNLSEPLLKCNQQISKIKLEVRFSHLPFLVRGYNNESI